MLEAFYNVTPLVNQDGVYLQLRLASDAMACYAENLYWGTSDTLSKAASFRAHDTASELDRMAALVYSGRIKAPLWAAG